MTLWTAEALRAATSGTLAAGSAITGVSIDTRSLSPGDLFVALRDVRDGHEFVAEALARGAAAAMVDRDPPGVAPDAPLLRVPDTLRGLEALGAAGRARFRGRVAAVTGSVGKTGTKEMLRLLLGALGPTHAAVASFNNHWGVPLTLARMPAGATFAVTEIGMNNPGEIAPLARLAAPHVVGVTAIGEAHIGHMGSLEAVAEEKGSIALGLAPGGTAVLPRDSEFFDRMAAIARAAGAGRIIGFGRGPAAEVRLAEANILRDGRTRAIIAVLGRPVEVTMPAMGLHHATNACCALALVTALGEDAARAAPALTAYAPGAGRGAPREIRVAGGVAVLIDESYNAAPPAMRAALQTLTLRPPGASGGRRIAVLGDMRELGEFSAALHAGLAPEAARADLVFCCGPEMARLYALLPAAKRGAHAADSAALAPLVKQALRPGDVVLIKGALGSRMALVVRALTEFPDVIFNLLAPYAEEFALFNLVRYTTFRAGAACLTALVFSLVLGPAVIRWLRGFQRGGQPIREDGPQSHLVTKKGTPTMGGVLILLALVLSTLLWADLRSGMVWAVMLVTVTYGLLGFADDWLKVTKRNTKGVSGRMKLVVQAGVGLAGAVWIMALHPPAIAGGLAMPIFKDLLIPLGILFPLVGMLVMMGASNAVNLTDGLDGLAIVPAMIAAGVFALIAYLVGNRVLADYLQLHAVPGANELAVFLAALIGAGLGFLWFNAPPAAVFMGDTGSLALGGALGAVAVATKHEIVLAIVGGLFVVETVSVIIQVFWYKRTGRRVFLMAPLHHHFEKKGWAEPTIVIRFWIIAMVLALVGLSTLKIR